MSRNISCYLPGRLLQVDRYPSPHLLYFSLYIIIRRSLYSFTLPLHEYKIPKPLNNGKHRVLLMYSHVQVAAIRLVGNRNSLNRIVF